MPRNVNRAIKNASQEVTENQEADAAAQAEFDASMDAAKADRNEPFFAEFTVTAATILNSPARARYGEAVQFKVTRQKKGNYVASFTPAEEGAEPVIGKLSRKPNVAVRAVISSMGGNEKEFQFDAAAEEATQAPMPEGAGSNQPETWFYDEESEIASRLNEVAEEVRTADANLVAAGKQTKEGWLGFGRSYNTAKAIFAEAGLVTDGEGETAKRGKAAWGNWLRTRFAGLENVKAILESKNAAAQAGFFALAPESVVEAVGVNTASTFMRKAEEAAKEFAVAVAESVAATRNAAEDEDNGLTVAQAQEAAKAKLEAREAGYADALKAWQDKATKAAEKGKTVSPFEDAKKAAPLAVIRWLFDTSVDSFDGSKLHKAIVKAWDDEVNKPSEEEQAEESAKKATAAITRKFADMDVDAAALHLLHILVAHEEPDAVLEALSGKLTDWQIEQEEKAKAAAAKEEATADAE